MLTSRAALRNLLFLLCTGMHAIYDKSSAQEIPQSGYPKDYFRVPLDFPVFLAGNFGELRPDHFHMGLDMKTHGKIGYPVCAAADGYVARIKVEEAGFGNAIYVNHPNGYTTVYVHLDHFFPALQQYVKEQQYKQQSWAVYLDIPPDMFPVRKGQVIAASGNTGGSQAPHLHFEIRDTKTDENRNPFLFGLPIIDHVPPVLTWVGIYDANESAYLQVPRLYSLHKAPGGYRTAGNVIVTRAGKVRVAIGASDYQTGSASKLGIYQATLLMDGKVIGGFTLDKFGYDVTRYVNAHMDYSLKAGGGPSLEYLSPLPGDPLPIYSHENADGLVHLDDDAPHEMVIEVRDAAGNNTRASFSLKKAGPPPFYDQGGLFVPGQVNVFENDTFLMYLPAHCLYDAVRPVFQRKPGTHPAGAVTFSPSYSIISGLVPAQDSFTVSIKPDTLPGDTETGKYVILMSARSKKRVSRVTWERGWASARFRDFGDYELVRDDEAPQIQPQGWKDGDQLGARTTLGLSVKDNLGETKDFKAELDGKWLMFRQKGNTYTYDIDDHFPAGAHTLVITISDEAGNTARSAFHLVRQ